MARVPNRSNDLARPRERKGAAAAKPITKGVARKVSNWDPDPEWDVIARMLWEGALRSGQSDFYQDSDWAVLYWLCDNVTHYQKTKRRSAQMFAALQSAMSTLLLTEGDRRRVQIELEKPQEAGDEAKAVMQAYMSGLAGPKAPRRRKAPSATP